MEISMKLIKLKLINNVSIGPDFNFWLDPEKIQCIMQLNPDLYRVVFENQKDYLDYCINRENFNLLMEINQ